MGHILLQVWQTMSCVYSLKLLFFLVTFIFLIWSAWFVSEKFLQQLLLIFLWDFPATFLGRRLSAHVWIQQQMHSHEVCGFEFPFYILSAAMYIIFQQLQSLDPTPLFIYSFFFSFLNLLCNSRLVSYFISMPISSPSLCVLSLSELPFLCVIAMSL